MVTLLAAKSRAMEGRGPEDALKLAAYSSDQAHSCIRKACTIAGIQHCRLLPTTGRPKLLVHFKVWNLDSRAKSLPDAISSTLAIHSKNQRESSTFPRHWGTSSQGFAWKRADAAERPWASFNVGFSRMAFRLSAETHFWEENLVLQPS